MSFQEHKPFGAVRLAKTNLCMGVRSTSRSRACSNHPPFLGVIYFNLIFIFGVWLSLVERLVRDQEVGRSNRLTPTKKRTKQQLRSFFIQVAGLVYHPTQVGISSPQVYIITPRRVLLRLDDIQFLWNWWYAKLRFDDIHGKPWFGLLCLNQVRLSTKPKIACWFEAREVLRA